MGESPLLILLSGVSVVLLFLCAGLYQWLAQHNLRKGILLLAFGALGVMVTVFAVQIYSTDLMLAYRVVSILGILLLGYWLIQDVRHHASWLTLVIKLAILLGCISMALVGYLGYRPIGLGNYFFLLAVVLAGVNYFINRSKSKAGSPAADMASGKTGTEK